MYLCAKCTFDLSVKAAQTDTVKELRSCDNCKADGVMCAEFDLIPINSKRAPNFNIEEPVWDKNINQKSTDSKPGPRTGEYLWLGQRHTSSIN